jgi:hypothetical protein
MPAVGTEDQTTVLAVCSDQAGLEEAVARLRIDGTPMRKVSIIGKDFEAIEKPLGFIFTRDGARDAAQVGAWSATLFTRLDGSAFLILPGLGAVIVGGPLAARLLRGIDRTLGGAAFGGLTSALIGLGLTKAQASGYESQVKAGKFLVIVQGDCMQIERAASLLALRGSDSLAVVTLEATSVR